MQSDTFGLCEDLDASLLIEPGGMQHLIPDAFLYLFAAGRTMIPVVAVPGILRVVLWYRRVDIATVVVTNIG